MKVSSLKQISHSELRHRILASLNLEPASSVSSLAQRLGFLRPSVSRAVKSLQDAGLITRTGRSLNLSEAGHEELARLNNELINEIKKSTDLASRIVLEQASEIGRQLEPLLKSQIGASLIDVPQLQIGNLAESAFLGIGKELADSPLFQLGKELANSPLFQLGKAINDNPIFHLGEIVSSPALQANNELANNSFFQAAKEMIAGVSLDAIEAITATAHIQTVNLNLLQYWKQETLSPLNHLVLENNLLLGNMMVDLEDITKLGTTVKQLLGGLIEQATWTTKVYDAYFIDALGGLKHVPSYEDLELSLTLPTTATASLVGSTKRIVQLETLSFSEEPMNMYVPRPPTYSEKYIELTPRLEAYLKPLGQRFIDKWEGAWQVLYSSSKDRHSQATHSGRELLMQVLAYLAPDNVFTKEDCKKHRVDKPSRKMRIKYILDYDHQSAVELIDSMATTLDRMYDVLVREAHRRDDNNHLDDTIIGQLVALEASLIMLLSLHSNI